MRRTQALIGTGCLSVLLWGPVQILAQQGSSPEDGGPVLTFGISSTLSATDNYNLDPNNSESTGLFDNRLSFGYENRRATDALSLNLSGVLRANEPPGGSNTFDDRRARLGYERQGVNSALSFGADYSLVSVDAFDPFNNAFSQNDPNTLPGVADLTSDRGDEEQIATRFHFETGLNDPLGFILDGTYRDRSFTGTTDPDLYDTRRFNLSGTTRFTLSPVTEAAVVLDYEDYSADDVPQTDRTTSKVSLGLRQALSPVDTLDALIGYKVIKTDETIGGLRQTDTDAGAAGRLSFTRELKRGTVGASFDLNRSVNGTTATWLVSRATPLPRGALAVSLGVASDVGDTLRPVGSLDFTHEMTRSTLTASLNQQVSTSSRSNELRTTQASLRYDYAINSLSGLAFTADVASIAQAGGPSVNDTVRANLRAVYSRDITQDWQVSSGYEYRVRDEDGVGTATSNRVFLTLARKFVLRP